MGDRVRLTLRRVAEMVGGRVRSGDPNIEIGNVVIDTRILQPGDFFIALRGSRFDGHDFVSDALQKRAGGALVARTFGDTSRDTPVVEVADTTKALQDLAREVRRASGTRVVAITGSAGKTTTKEIAAELLSARFRVVRNRGNLNNHIGVPLSLLQLREQPEVAVMELGMSRAGEIRMLVGIAEPEVRVWTNVGDAHIGFFESPDAIADAKAEILERADADDLLVCNADDPRVMARVGGFRGRTMTFGTVPGATVHAREVETLGIDGMRARVTTPVGERRISTPLIGRGNLHNLLAATAVAVEFRVPLDTIVDRAAKLRPAERRGNVRRLRGVVLIDDSYNSSPAALRLALDVIANERRRFRKVAVIGEMLELGDQSRPLHQELGQRAAYSGLQLLVAIGGGPARALADAAIQAGMAPSAVSYFESSETAAPVVAGAIREGDLILVKGSRGTRTDIIADRIAAEFS